MQHFGEMHFDVHLLKKCVQFLLRATKIPWPADYGEPVAATCSDLHPRPSRCQQQDQKRDGQQSIQDVRNRENDPLRADRMSESGVA